MRYEVKLALIAALGGTMSLCLFLYGWKNREPVNFLNRPESGLGAQTQNLEVRMAGKRHDISVSLMEIPWEKEQAQEQLGRAAEELEKIVLNDNEDLEHIRKDMDMPSNVPGTKIAIQWYLDSWEYVSPGGSVKNTGMSGPCEVNIQAVLTLGEEELVWEKTARICPPETPDEEQRLQILSVQLQKLQEDSRDRTLILPTVIQGEHIAWYLPMDDRWMWFLLLTAAACMAHEVTAMITKKNGVEESRDIIAETVLQEPVPKIVERGTQTPPTYIKPISGGRFTSGFKRRWGRMHKGVDWACPIGTAVMASCGGTVVQAGWFSGYDNCITIRHPDGKQTRYGHLSKILVSSGQKVTQGQKIALSGNTGRSTGPHVHFEIIINGSQVNPLPYLN